MKIAIIGSHCTGKTTLVNKLQAIPELYDYDFYPESIREISRLGFPYNENAGDSSQLAILALHLLHLTHDNMITDRSLLDNYVYAKVLREMGSNISSYCVDILKKYFLDNIERYDIYAFCPIKFELKADGFRDTNKKFQEAISDEMLKMLIEYVPEDRYLLLMGETPERLEQLLEFMKAKEKLNV